MENKIESLKKISVQSIYMSDCKKVRLTWRTGGKWKKNNWKRKRKRTWCAQLHAYITVSQTVQIEQGDHIMNGMKTGPQVLILFA